MTALEEAVEFAAVCTLADLPVGLGRAYVVGSHRIAIFRTRYGRIFAVADRCPHKGGPLSDGMLAGDQIVCPMHSFRFDSAGNCDQPGVCSVRTYPVELAGDVVRVGIPR